MYFAISTTKGRFAAVATFCLVAISITSTLIPLSLSAQSRARGNGLPPATIPDNAATPTSSADSRDQGSMEPLKRLAAEQVQTDGEFLGKTRFRIDQQGHTFFYDLRPAPPTFILAGDDHYVVPLEALVRIEAVRRDFRASIPDEDFWTAPLDSIEVVVQRCVEDLDAPQSEQSARATEQACATRIQEHFDKLRDSILSFAAAHKLTLVELPQTRDPAPGYRVQIKIDPPRARVRVMPLIEYKKYQYFKVPQEQYQWNDLLDSESDMIGWYHFRAEWPAELHGVEEGDFCIKKPGSITFKPPER